MAAGDAGVPANWNILTKNRYIRLTLSICRRKALLSAAGHKDGQALAGPPAGNGVLVLREERQGRGGAAPVRDRRLHPAELPLPREHLRPALPLEVLPHLQQEGVRGRRRGARDTPDASGAAPGITFNIG